VTSIDTPPGGRRPGAAPALRAAPATLCVGVAALGGLAGSSL